MSPDEPNKKCYQDVTDLPDDDLNLYILDLKLEVSLIEAHLERARAEVSRRRKEQKRQYGPELPAIKASGKTRPN